MEVGQCTGANGVLPVSRLLLLGQESSTLAIATAGPASLHRRSDTPDLVGEETGGPVTAVVLTDEEHDTLQRWPRRGDVVAGVAQLSRVLFRLCVRQIQQGSVR